METTVYGDLLFFVNFCMDFQCLFLTAKLLHRPFSIRRGGIASALGALYAVAALFWGISGAPAFFFDLAAGAGIAFITFGGRGVKLRAFLIPFALYFGVSLAVGGVMSGAGALLSHFDLPLTAGSDISFPAFLFLAALGGGATFLWGKLCRRRAGVTRAKLRLAVGEKEITVSAFADSGNFLSDPIGGRPVALLDFGTAKKILPERVIAAAESGNFSEIAAWGAEWSRRVRLVPAGSVAGEKMLLAVAPDRAYLDAGGGEAPCDLLIAPTKLRPDTGDEALIPSELIIK